MQQNQQEIHQQIDQAILSVKEKMKIVNFNNFEPPYLLHTLTKFRQTNFSKFLKEIKIEGEKDTNIREKLKIVHYIIEKFDDECFDIYSAQLIQPYIRRMFQDNYQFDNIKFKEVNAQFNLNSEIQETLSQAAEWLAQIQISQDLLSRAQLYFKMKIPHIIEKVREEGIKSQKSSWFGAMVSNIKKLLSFGLRKGSKMVQTTFFTAVAPGAIMLTLAIIGGSATLPWKSTINVNNLITIAAAAAVPFILDSMADQVQKSDYQVKLKRWAQTFELLADSIRNFNEKLQQAIRNCTLSSNLNEFLIERTNLQKIIHHLNKNIQTVTKFDQDKFTEMRDRTQAYFRQYIQVKQDEWTLIVSKQQMEELNRVRQKEKQRKQQEKRIEQEKQQKKLESLNSMEEKFTLLQEN